MTYHVLVFKGGVVIDSQSLPIYYPLNAYIREMLAQGYGLDIELVGGEE